MTGWALAGIIILAFSLGCCFGVMITALMCANGRDEYNTKINEEKPEKTRSNCP